MGISTSLTSKTQQDTTRDGRLHGRFLMLVRIIWGTITALTILHVIFSIPLLFVHLQQLCSGADSMHCLQPYLAHELQTLRISIVGIVRIMTISAVLFSSVWIIVGGILFWRRSNDRIALFVSLALVMYGGTAFEASDSLSRLVPIWQLLLVGEVFLSQLFLFLFAYLFPDGRFVPRWTAILGVLLFPLIEILSFFPHILPYKWLLNTQIIWVSLFLISGIFAQVYRYWRVSDGVQRQQTKWVMFGVVIALLGSQCSAVLTIFVPQPHIFLVLFIDAIAFFSLLCIPLSLCIAILRFHLWNINLLISRALVYTALTASGIGIYVLVVGSLSLLFQASNNPFIALIATGCVAWLFQPLRTRLQTTINRVVYGKAYEPYAVISQLGQRLTAVLAPEAVLPTIVETVAHALNLPYVAIALKGEKIFSIVSAYGIVKDEVVRIPLLYQHEQVGELLVAQRSSTETFTPTENKLLHELAHQAGVAVYAIRLTSELQRSREHLVTAREEERRRIRRDLHDGLGPTLAALNLKAGAIRNLMYHDLTAADALIAEWRAELRTAIADIRNLVYDLRPPALDDLGLIGAIREQSAHYMAKEAMGLKIFVEAPEAFPPLPAAVEVAAYRIVQEALTNVVRHAYARSCRVTFTLSHVLQLEVLDDGTGMKQEQHKGVGLISMRERAEELGGTCILESLAGGGTRVCATLPLLKE